MFLVRCITNRTLWETIEPEVIFFLLKLVRYWHSAD